MRGQRLSPDFWRFWTGQTISNLGSSFTFFALPLLVYELTGSAVNLAATTAAYLLPYLLFGLVIGAWVDRVDRKRLMIAVDLLRAAAIATVPALAAMDALSVWWIYGMAFVTATFTIAFDACEFAAVPSLVGKDDLVTANGRIQASYQAATFLGPIMAGVMLGSGLPVEDVLLVDAASFVASAAALALVRSSFNPPADERREPTTIRRDVRRGPALRALPPRAAEHLDHDGAVQLRRCDGDHAARALREGAPGRLECTGRLSLLGRKRRHRRPEPPRGRRSGGGCRSAWPRSAR